MHQQNNVQGSKSVGEDCWVTAKYDYSAQGSHELDLRKNERLLLLDDSKHWWRVMNSRNQAGYVPSNYVKKEKPSIFDSIKKRVKKGGGSRTLPSAGGTPTRGVDSPGGVRGNTPIDPSEAIGWAVVKYNYQAQQMDELSLVKGTRVLILEKSNDGWWRGHYNNLVGWFPSNYTTEEPAEDDHTYTMAENVLDVVVALYSFTAQNEHELSFTKGERMEVLDRPPSDPEWYRARNTQGQVGLIPKNYVQELHEVVDARTPRSREPSQTRQLPPPGPSNSAHPAPATNGGAHNAETHLAQGMQGMNINAAAPTPPAPAMSVGSVPQDKSHFTTRDWYYGPITRAQCDDILNQRGHDGDFLIRDSETNVGDFSVSLKAAGRNKHFRVHVENGLYCIGQRKFQNLDQLVDHYQRSPIYTSQKGEKLYLIRPLPKP
ncbi:cytoplasmic protein NCK1-like isoform X1 [Portunus trituberculatus]|nr:cytoplasmic protein NCK1-like isoform X1 [Portunus trituberculatus]XP_045136545.1 cytoplasmic protein NCK1-like isoform X1 [Portunus trituberculatus]